MAPSETLSAQETALLLKLNVKRVQALARQGQLPAKRVGRKWLFPRGKIEALCGISPPAARSKSPGRGAIELSARNQLRGKVVSLSGDGIMAEVRLDIGGQELVAIITRASAERLRVRVGEEVLAVIKSTEVMIGRD